MILREPDEDRDGEPRGVRGRDAAGAGAGTFAERRWSIAAGVCLVAAAALWVFVGVDAAFVVATFGVLAWFWDQRNRIERRSIESGGRREADEDDEDGDEEFADEDGDEAADETGGESEDDDENPKDVKS